MRIMLDKSPAQIAEYTERYSYEFWQLRTPLTGYRLANVPYAIDNGCFTEFNRKTWDRLLEEAEAKACDFSDPTNARPPVFVTLPDIVASAARTLDLFDYFKTYTVGFNRALVLQDGIANHRIPWDDLAAVFVGGSDSFKVSKEARDCAKVAKMLGKWVHVGRVNTARRVRDWLDLADSIDGSGISRFDHMLEETLAAIRGDHPQRQLDIACAG